MVHKNKKKGDEAKAVELRQIKTVVSERPGLALRSSASATDRLTAWPDNVECEAGGRSFDSV
jgi:hypothetical protein